MKQISLKSAKNILVTSVLLIAVPSAALAQDKLENPIYDAKADSGDSSAKVHYGALPGDFKIDFEPTGDENQLNYDEYVQYQAPNEVDPCAATIKKAAPRSHFNLQTGAGQVVLQLCVEEYTAHDEETRAGAAMYNKGGGLNGEAKKCEIKSRTQNGATISLASDSDSVCNFLALAQTTHPQITVKGFMTTMYFDMVQMDEDGNLTLTPLPNEPTSYIGIRSAGFRK